MTPIQRSASVAAAGRFRIEQRLGAGAFGVVYRAIDTERNSVVALKTLRQADPVRLYRFKQEFRSLAGITHPNLVTLYELLSDGDRWFFTMELIEGIGFREYVCGDSGSKPPASKTRDISSEETVDQSDAPTIEEQISRLPARDFERVRTAFSQLASGLRAIHDAGKLHRDVKPSNVLVTPAGRVVILDFGLVAELGADASPGDREVAGTPAYMSPEQAAREAVTEASDWYGFGVMLYEALAGRLPVEGKGREVLERKQSAAPAAPSVWNPDAPADLDSLCVRLLRVDPALRPGGVEIARCLAGGAAPPPFAPAAQPGTAPFVGRERELAVLREAFGETKSGRRTTVLAHGSSGMGKTALVRRFLEETARAEPETLVLAGRCYDRESVPYKALDAVVDALSQYLRAQPEESREIMPRDVEALVRLFPVLQRARAALRVQRRPVDIQDPFELRRRGFAALRELLGRVASMRPTVLFVDDLQWGDLDSIPLIQEILREPDAPSMLAVFAYRSEEVDSSPLLNALLPTLREAGAVREIRVGELSAEESRRLALDLAGDEGIAEEQVAAIAREAGGSPFFLEALLRHHAFGGAVETTLDRVVESRVRALAEPARRALEVIAVAARPIPEDFARRAAGLETGMEIALEELRSAHLVRARAAGSRRELETYHDRVREIVAAHIAPRALAERHRSLALVYEAQGETADHETIAVHFLAAGEAKRSAEYAAEAAGEAANALAFDRAARLFRLALRHGEATPAEQAKLWTRLGDVLALAGRGRSAAEAYLEAASRTEPPARPDLQRRSAEQLLLSGHVEKAFDALMPALEAYGAKLARSERAALASLLWHRAVLRLRGVHFREKSEAEIAPVELLRLDACWSVANGLGLIDFIRTPDLQTRNLLRALRVGEPYRVARALMSEAAFLACAGGSAIRRAQGLVGEASRIAERMRQPELRALVATLSALVMVSAGQWSQARALFRKGDELRPGHDPRTIFEKGVAILFSLIVAEFLGELKEVSAEAPDLLAGVRERGNRFMELSLVTRVTPLVWLARGDPGRARRELDDAREFWSPELWPLHAIWDHHARIDIELYTGDMDAALARVKAEEKVLGHSLVLRVQAIRCEWNYACARTFLGAAVASRERPSLLRMAERHAGRLERERVPWSTNLAAVIYAGTAAARGDRTRAVELLADAEAGFDTCHMSLHAKASRRRRGELLGGQKGRALRESADAWMASQEIREPERMTAMLAPGFPLGSSGEVGG